MRISKRARKASIAKRFGRAKGIVYKKWLQYGKTEEARRDEELEAAGP